MKIRTILGASILLLVSLIAVALPVQSATFSVDSLLDNADAFAGDGICDDSSGFCTLRAAIQETNALAGDDKITFSVTGTITLTSALPIINQSLSINGPGADQLTVSGDNVVRPFQISSTNVEFHGITISNGVANSGSPPRGGGIYVETASTLMLTRVVVSNNMALSGGGIFSYGHLTINNSTISDNSASQTGSYVFVWGGGIHAEGIVLTINNSTLSGNSSTAMGGVQAYALGSGVSLLGGELFINNSTISGNSANASGGSSNNGAHGGGIYAYADTDLSITNGTIASNSVSATGAGITEQGGGIYCCDNGTLTLTNSIVSNNTATSGVNNCYRLTAVFNTIYNIENANTCELSGVGNQINTDPLLEVLGDYAGLTQTHHLQVSSPAIDAGSNVDCLATDQRGVTRPVDGDAVSGAVCDIGAVEYSPSATLIVNPDDINFGTVTGIDLSGPQASDFSVDLGGGSSGTCGPLPFNLEFLNECTLTLSFTPAEEGARNAQLDISSSGGAGVVTVVGTGTVQPVPGIKVTPQELDFAVVGSSDAVEKNIYILNEGSADLAIGIIGVTDPLEAPYSISSDECSNINLQPGTFCTLTIRLDPNNVLVAILFGSLSISGLYFIGMLSSSRRNMKLWFPIYLVAIILGAMLSSCHSSSGGSSATAYSDSFDVPSNDPDTSTVTVNVKGSIQ